MYGRTTTTRTGNEFFLLLLKRKKQHRHSFTAPRPTAPANNGYSTTTSRPAANSGARSGSMGRSQPVTRWEHC